MKTYKISDNKYISVGKSCLEFDTSEEIIKVKIKNRIPKNLKSKKVSFNQLENKIGFEKHKKLCFTTYEVNEFIRKFENSIEDKILF